MLSSGCRCCLPISGHVAPKSTYWYLSAVPELLAVVADRIDAMSEVEP